MYTCMYRQNNADKVHMYIPMITKNYLQIHKQLSGKKDVNMCH